MKTHHIPIFACIAVVCFLISGCGKPDSKQQTSSEPSAQKTAKTSLQTPKSYAELVALPPEELAKVDIARINLLCAEGLPGSEILNVDKVLSILDGWVRIAKQAEQKYMLGYFQNPGRYDHSLAKFKAINLALTLKQDLGCGYNMDLIQSGAMTDVRSTCFFRNSQDLFLHGFTENRSGSCSSLPVLMVAIGRHCGYPLKLVTCKGHLFCRWDDGKERFNIETACEGVDSKPDSYYQNWPHPSTEAEVQSEGYLKSLTTSEELAVFSEIRAACLQENQQFSESVEAYEVALRAFPPSKFLKQYLNNIKKRE